MTVPSTTWTVHTNVSPDTRYHATPEGVAQPPSEGEGVLLCRAQGDESATPEGVSAVWWIRRGAAEAGSASLCLSASVCGVPASISRLGGAVCGLAAVHGERRESASRAGRHARAACRARQVLLAGEDCGAESLGVRASGGDGADVWTATTGGRACPSPQWRWARQSPGESADRDARGAHADRIESPDWDVDAELRGVCRVWHDGAEALGIRALLALLSKIAR